MNILMNSNPTQRSEVIQQACHVLANGGLLIFPTETTYGAGVDATNPQAVQKLLQYKSRREGKPLSIAVIDQEMAETYVELTESAKRLYARFLPGPVTIVSKSKGVVAEGVASEYGTLGVRIPDYALVIEILKAYGKPITATSANGSGQKRPYTIQDIFDGLSEKQKSLIDLVIDDGELPPNPPSTVIDTTVATPVIFRQGDIAISEAVSADQAEYTSQRENETHEIAQRIMLKYWEDVKSHGLFIALHGSLGAGKTTLVKGIAKFLQIQETLTSPTYVYLQSYDYERYTQKGQLHHLDLWRLENTEMIDQLGIEELLGPNNVVAIEWPSVANEELISLVKKSGSKYLEIHIEDIQDVRHIVCKTLS